jgi:hypothetical protein
MLDRSCAESLVLGLHPGAAAGVEPLGTRRLRALRALAAGGSSTGLTRPTSGGLGAPRDSTMG